MSNPKFLNIEKKVPYNIRLPKRLIDKYNAYAELTGNTTTNIINNILDDFIADKIILNDYLDNIGGITIKIPYAIHQKKTLISSSFINTNLERYRDDFKDETYLAETFEIKKIPNNLDIYDGDSYVANTKSLLYNNYDKTKIAIHSGIEFFIYNIAESIVADDFMRPLTDALYCLYFEVTPDNKVHTYLIDYLTAINLLSESNNNDYKDLLIACVSELDDADELRLKLKDEYLTLYAELDEIFVNDIDAYDEKENESDEIVNNELLPALKSKLNEIADKYNSGNIILFGSDIFERIAIKNVDITPDYFDDIIDEKINAILDNKIAELEKTEKRSNEKLSEIEKMNAEMHDKIDKLSDVINRLDK